MQLSHLGQALYSHSLSTLGSFVVLCYPPSVTKKKAALMGYASWTNLWVKGLGFR